MQSMASCIVGLTLAVNLGRGFLLVCFNTALAFIFQLTLAVNLGRGFLSSAEPSGPLSRIMAVPQLVCTHIVFVVLTIPN